MDPQMIMSCEEQPLIKYFSCENHRPYPYSSTPPSLELDRHENYHYYSKDLIDMYRVNSVMLSCKILFNCDDFNKILELCHNILTIVEQLSSSRIYMQDIHLIEKKTFVLDLVGGLNEVTFGCKMLVQLISSQVEDFFFDNCFADNRTVSLKQLILDRYTSRIIGKNGQNIKRVINSYGCKIMISSKISDVEGAFREVLYEGFVENVIKGFIDILVYSNYLHAQHSLNSSHKKQYTAKYQPYTPPPSPFHPYRFSMESNQTYGTTERMPKLTINPNTKLYNESNGTIAVENSNSDNTIDPNNTNPLLLSEVINNVSWRCKKYNDASKEGQPLISLMLPQKFKLHFTFQPYTFTYGQYSVLIPFNSPESIMYTINNPEIPPTRIFHQKTRYKYKLFMAKRTYLLIFPHDQIYSNLIRTLCGVKINLIPVRYESISNFLRNYTFANNSQSHILDTLTLFSEFDADEIKNYARNQTQTQCYDNQDILGYNIEIIGDGKSVWICMYILFSLYRNNIDHSERNFHIEMIIPGSTVGRIIGCCGKVVVSIQQQTNTLISIPKNRQGGIQASVIIAGPFIGIQAALCKIRHIIYTGFMDEFVDVDYTNRIQPNKPYSYGQDVTNYFPISREK